MIDQLFLTSKKCDLLHVFLSAVNQYDNNVNRRDCNLGRGRMMSQKRGLVEVAKLLLIIILTINHSVLVLYYFISVFLSV